MCSPGHLYSEVGKMRKEPINLMVLAALLMGTGVKWRGGEWTGMAERTGGRRERLIYISSGSFAQGADVGWEGTWSLEVAVILVWL